MSTATPITSGSPGAGASAMSVSSADGGSTHVSSPHSSSAGVLSSSGDMATNRHSVHSNQSSSRWEPDLMVCTPASACNFSACFGEDIYHSITETSVIIVGGVSVSKKIDNDRLIVRQ